MNACYWSAERMAQAIQGGAMSAEEALRMCWQRVDEHDAALNAVCCRVDERALERARAADRATARGESYGPLHGVPMTVKEGYDLVGTPTTWGQAEFAQNFPKTDADAVRRFEAAGAIVFGKTNVPAQLRDWQSDNPIYGRTVNPWNQELTPGGSSGGSAVALAAGYAFMEAGSDIGGSLRNPAHYCGVCAHKPTFGIVPQVGHAPVEELVPPDIAVCGPMARNVSDLRLGLEIMLGVDGAAATGWQLRLPPPRHRSIDKFRIAVVLDSEACAVTEETKQQLTDLAAQCKAAGARVDRDVGLPVDARESHRLYIQLLRAVIAPELSDDEFQAESTIAAALALDDQSYQAWVSRALTQTYRDWNLATQRRVRLQRQWAEFFTHHDALLIPAAPTTAWPHDERERFDREIKVDNATIGYYDQLFWAGLSGVVHLPSTVIPMGLSSDGLPLGVQIVAPYLEDWTAVALAHHIERMTGGFITPPGFEV